MCLLVLAFSLFASLAPPQQPQIDQEALQTELVERIHALDERDDEGRVALGRQAIEAFAATSDDESVLELCQVVGLSLLNLGRFDEAKKELALGAEIAARLGRDLDRAFFLGNLALAATELGDYPRAQEAIGVGLEIAREHRNTEMAWKLLNLRGAAHQRAGEPDLALASYRDAVGLLEELGEPEKLAVLLNNVGVSLLNQERYVDADDFFARAQELAEETGNDVHRAGALGNRGDVLHLQGDHDGALALHHEALALREALGDERALANSHHSLGAVHRGLGNLPASLANLERALAIEERLGLAADRVRTLASLAETYALLGESRAALDSALASQDALEATDTRAREAYVLGALARAHEAEGNFETALDYERRAGEARQRLLAHDSSAEVDALRLRLAEGGRELALRHERLVRKTMAGAAIGASLLGLFGWLLFSMKRRAHRDLLVAHEHIRRANTDLAQRARELEEAADTIERLEELLSVCANCKRVRYDNGMWHAVEQYLLDHAATSVTHGICPECVAEVYPDYRPVKTVEGAPTRRPT